MTIPALIPSSAVEINSGRPVTTSLAVAQIFEKEHFHVLRDVQSLGCSPEFNASNFGVVDYTDAKGERRPMIQMTKDGFTILAMGYTGAKAMAFKEAYIQRFNEMEANLRPSGPAALPTSTAGYRRFVLTLRDNGTFESMPVPADALIFAPEALPQLLGDSTSGAIPRSLLPAILGAVAERLAERPLGWRMAAPRLRHQAREMDGLYDLLSAWIDLWPVRAITTTELIEKVVARDSSSGSAAHPALQAAAVSVLGELGKWGTKELGYLLRQWSGRIVQGLSVYSAGRGRYGSTWRVERHSTAALPEA